MILIDRPGHGWSTRENLSASTPAAQAAMIDEALGAAQHPARDRHRPFMGRGAGCSLALNHPSRVGGLVLLSPVTHPWPGGIA